MYTNTFMHAHHHRTVYSLFVLSRTYRLLISFKWSPQKFRQMFSNRCEVHGTDNSSIPLLFHSFLFPRAHTRTQRIILIIRIFDSHKILCICNAFVSFGVEGNVELIARIGDDLLSHSLHIAHCKREMVNENDFEKKIRIGIGIAMASHSQSRCGEGWIQTEDIRPETQSNNLECDSASMSTMCLWSE